MEKRIYLHSIGFLPRRYYYEPKDKRIILEEILKSGSLLSMRKQGRPSNNGFCGLDYISLCDYSKKDLDNGRKHYNGYYQYVIDSTSLVFDKDKVEEETTVYHPILVRNSTRNIDGYKNMYYWGTCEKRYSDLPDEVQVKDELSLSSMNALTFPAKSFNLLYSIRSKKKRIELLKDEINRTKELLDKYGYNVPIYDIETFNEMTDENIERLILKR